MKLNAGDLLMKKLLSTLMTILFVLPNSMAKGYNITDLPGGEKKVVYSYGELQKLSEQHKQLARDIMKKSKKYDNAKFVSGLATCGSMIAGAILIPSSVNKNGATKRNKLAAGAGLFVSGLLGLIGGQSYLNRNMENLEKQQHAVNLTKGEITGTKSYVDTFIAKDYVTAEQAAKDFYYAIYIDNQGFAYKTEFGGASVVHEIVPLETKYKFNVSDFRGV